MFRRGRRTSVREAVNEKAERLLSLAGVTSAQGTVLIAQEDDEVVGVVVFRLNAGEAELVALVTDPNHRHRGVARRLVLEVSHRARAHGCGWLRVRLPRANDAALGFFRALGFDETHVALDRAL